MQKIIQKMKDEIYELKKNFFFDSIINAYCSNNFFSGVFWLYADCPGTKQDASHHMNSWLLFAGDTGFSVFSCLVTLITCHFRIEKEIKPLQNILRYEREQSQPLSIPEENENNDGVIQEQEKQEKGDWVISIKNYGLREHSPADYQPNVCYRRLHVVINILFRAGGLSIQYLQSTALNRAESNTSWNNCFPSSFFIWAGLFWSMGVGAAMCYASYKNTLLAQASKKIKQDIKIARGEVATLQNLVAFGGGL